MIYGIGGKIYFTLVNRLNNTYKQWLILFTSTSFKFKRRTLSFLRILGASGTEVLVTVMEVDPYREVMNGLHRDLHETDNAACQVFIVDNTDGNASAAVWSV